MHFNILEGLIYEPFHTGGRYHIETRANQWTGFYMIAASVMKGLKFDLTNVNQLSSDFEWY